MRLYSWFSRLYSRWVLFDMRAKFTTIERYCRASPSEQRRESMSNQKLEMSISKSRSDRDQKPPACATPRPTSSFKPVCLPTDLAALHARNASSNASDSSQQPRTAHANVDIRFPRRVHLSCKQQISLRRSHKPICPIINRLLLTFLKATADPAIPPYSLRSSTVLFPPDRPSP